MTAEEEKKFMTVKIPVAQYRRIKKRLSGTGFTSVSEYVGYVLDEVLNSLEGEETEEESFSAEDEEKVKARLKALGYLD